MIAAVAETHIALWFLFNDPRLSDSAGEFIERAAAEGNRIIISPISCAEIIYLVEKNRLTQSA